jgi:hypothetical protein
VSYDHNLGPSHYHIATKTDWCHWCGQQQQMRFAEIVSPANAAHGPDKCTNYLRVCQACLQTLAQNFDKPTQPRAKYNSLLEVGFEVEHDFDDPDTLIQHTENLELVLAALEHRLESLKRQGDGACEAFNIVATSEN